MKYRLILIAACVALAACSDDKSNGPSVVVLPDTGNTTNNAQTDMGTTSDAESDATVTEDFGTDTNVTMPGFLNGVWVVKVDDVAKATLTIRHIEGDEAAVGSFVSQSPPSSGLLNAVRWQDDTMSASWNIRVDNTPETFGVSDGIAADLNTITGRYTDSSTGQFTNCVVERQP